MIKELHHLLLVVLLLLLLQSPCRGQHDKVTNIFTFEVGSFKCVCVCV